MGGGKPSGEREERKIQKNERVKARRGEERTYGGRPQKI